MSPNAATTNSQHDEEDISTTQQVVPDLIERLYKANTEVIKPSVGPSFTVQNDPHLRLRRTLTPSLQIGLPGIPEAQYMIQGSTGKRINLAFTYKENDFTMDVYVWGASEEEATHRLIAIHGISPGISRTRWHQLGERFAKSDSGERKVRFVAVDWHSIDRSLDKPNTEFLTMLPKHFFAPELPEDVMQQLETDKVFGSPEAFEKLKASAKLWGSTTPRDFEEASDILRAIIEQGLEWGTDEKKFILCIKSWSGGFGVTFLSRRATDDAFYQNISASVIMHPGVFDPRLPPKAVHGLPTLICWAQDDIKIPFALSRYFASEAVKLVDYETGGHANFDGKTPGQPNFDREVVAWFHSLE